MPVDSAGYFDNVPGGTAHDFRRRSVRMLEDLGISVEFSHHEAGPGPERDRPALRRRADDGRQHHDVPHRHQRGRDRAGRLRDVHAEAVLRPARLRHAHPHVAVRGRRERVLRGRRAVPALEDRPPVHRRPADPRARDHRRHEPVRELVQAALGRRRGAQLRHAGATTTARRSCACRSTSPARARAHASSTAPSTRRRTRTSRSRCCSLPGSRASKKGYELPPEAEDNVWSLSDTERRALGYSPLPASLDHAIAAHGGVGARRRDARRAGVQLRAARTSAPSGATTARR